MIHCNSRHAMGVLVDTLDVLKKTPERWCNWLLDGILIFVYDKNDFAENVLQHYQI